MDPIDGTGELLNEPLFRTRQVQVGIFRARPDHAAFTTAGLPSLPTFVFPRSAVWIEHEGQRPFVADPNVVTLYNPGARYRRRLLRRVGDRCDWFQITPGLLSHAARRALPSGARPDAPFRELRVPADPGLYLRQRLLTRYVRESPSPDPDRVERAVIGLLERVLWLAREPERPDRSDTERVHRDLVERARAELVLRFKEALPLGRLAARLNTSKHHLCRVFKRRTGATIHQYQTRLRLAEALERIQRGSRLTEAALDLGFSSHSHFTERFRTSFGFAPGLFRELASNGEKVAGAAAGRSA